MHGRPLPDGPAPFTTLVELTFDKRKVEHWIRFGRKAYEKIIDRRRSVVGFAPAGAPLAGTIASIAQQIQASTAPCPNRMSRLPIAAQDTRVK